MYSPSAMFLVYFVETLTLTQQLRAMFLLIMILFLKPLELMKLPIILLEFYRNLNDMEFHFNVIQLINIMITEAMVKD